MRRRFSNSVALSLLVLAACGGGMGSAVGADQWQSGWQSLVDSEVRAWKFDLEFDLLTGELHSAQPDDLRLPLDDEALAELEIERALAQNDVCASYVDGSLGYGGRSSVLIKFLSYVFNQSPQGEAWRTAPDHDDSKAVEKFLAFARDFYSEATVQTAHQMFVEKCGIEVPDGYHFETIEELENFPDWFVDE